MLETLNRFFGFFEELGDADFFFFFIMIYLNGILNG